MKNKGFMHGWWIVVGFIILIVYCIGFIGVIDDFTLQTLEMRWRQCIEVVESLNNLINSEKQHETHMESTGEFALISVVDNHVSNMVEALDMRTGVCAALFNENLNLLTTRYYNIDDIGRYDPLADNKFITMVKLLDSDIFDTFEVDEYGAVGSSLKVYFKWISYGGSRMLLMFGVTQLKIIQTMAGTLYRWCFSLIVTSAVILIISGHSIIVSSPKNHGCAPRKGLPVKKSAKQSERRLHQTNEGGNDT